MSHAQNCLCLYDTQPSGIRWIYQYAAYQEAALDLKKPSLRRYGFREKREKYGGESGR